MLWCCFSPQVCASTVNYSRVLLTVVEADEAKLN